MSRPSGDRLPNELSREGLEELLRRLDPDPAVAAAQYNRLRERLIQFFDWEGCGGASPAALADDTLDRVARKIREGAEVPRVAPFALGVARFVCKEARTKNARTEHALREYAARRDTAEGALPLECLDQCLAQLDERRRELILAYYAADGSARIEHRRRLAERLGLNQTALRNRALRIRQDLERCFARCLETGPRDTLWNRDIMSERRTPEENA